ncbi:MAG: hypothetical protein RMY34_22620 [Aulosira sp. DedQUE10]|nr:hypothetical protein [Aulosira sp. DedQUE10]
MSDRFLKPGNRTLLQTQQTRSHFLTQPLMRSHSIKPPLMRSHSTKPQ